VFFTVVVNNAEKHVSVASGRLIYSGRARQARRASAILRARAEHIVSTAAKFAAVPGRLDFTRKRSWEIRAVMIVKNPSA
jgi:hypothetical protein